MASGSSEGSPWVLNPGASGLGAHRRPDGCQATGPGVARSLSLEYRAEARWPLQDSNGCCTGAMMWSHAFSSPE